MRVRKLKCGRLVEARLYTNTTAKYHVVGNTDELIAEFEDLEAAQVYAERLSYEDNGTVWPSEDKAWALVEVVFPGMTARDCYDMSPLLECAESAFSAEWGTLFEELKKKS